MTGTAWHGGRNVSGRKEGATERAILADVWTGEDETWPGHLPAEQVWPSRSFSETLM